MPDWSLDTSLLIAGLVLGLLISIAAGAVLEGLCEWLAPESSQRKLGILMLLLYVPILAYVWRYKMEEVTPMAAGVLISGLIFSICIHARSSKALPLDVKIAWARHQKLEE